MYELSHSRHSFSFISNHKDSMGGTKMQEFLSSPTLIVFGSIIDAQFCSGNFLWQGHLRVKRSYNQVTFTSHCRNDCSNMTISARHLRGLHADKKSAEMQWQLSFSLLLPEEFSSASFALTSLCTGHTLYKDIPLIGGAAFYKRKHYDHVCVFKPCKLPAFSFFLVLYPLLIQGDLCILCSFFRWQMWQYKLMKYFSKCASPSDRKPHCSWQSPQLTENEFTCEALLSISPCGKRCGVTTTGACTNNGVLLPGAGELHLTPDTEHELPPVVWELCDWEVWLGAWAPTKDVIWLDPNPRSRVVRQESSLTKTPDLRRFNRAHCFPQSS